MPGHLSLKRKHHLGGNVWVFIFVPEPNLTWVAGQFIRVELPHAEPDDAGTKRKFTITSAPHEREVHIATRLTTSTFKQTLATLPANGRMNVLDPPAGDFIWPTNPHPPLLFVAQGIGITPVISNLRQRHLTGQSMPATVIHANLTSLGPFRDELKDMARNHPELTYLTTSKLPTPTHVAELIPNLRDALIYASGPRPLIGLLAPPYNLPLNRLKQDQFTGYASADY